MPDISEFCPHCGRPVREKGAVSSAVSGPTAPTAVAPPTERQTLSPARLTPATYIPEREDTPAPAQQPPVPWDDRISGALAYLTFVPAVIFLFVESYQKRKFVRFHAAQSLLFWGGALVFVVLGLVASMFGWLFLWLLVGTLVGMALFFAWLLLSIKALQGEWFGLPLLGTLAEHYAVR